MRSRPAVAVWLGGLALALVATHCGEQEAIGSLPVAEAGFDRVVSIGTEVRFDGALSADPAGATLTYAWRLRSRPAESQAALIAAETATPRLVPDRAGTYLVELVVDNGRRRSLPDLVAVRATGGTTTNQPPVVVVGCQGGGCTVAHGDGTLTLVGNQTTDPNDAVQTLVFAWSQVVSDCATQCPGLTGCAPLTDAVTWTSATSVQNPSFDAPDAVGTLVFRLEVTDPGGLADADCLSVTVTNNPPVVVVQQPGGTSRAEGEAFQLDGSSSGDYDTVDVARLTYLWSPPPSADLIYTPSHTAPVVTVRAGNSLRGTTVQFKLAVSDPFATAEPCSASCAGTCCVAMQITTIAGKAAGETCYFDSECQSADCDESAGQCQ